jgi:exosortase B
MQNPTLLARMSGAGKFMPWWPVLIGLVVLYLPTYWDLAHDLWHSDDYAHGPIVLVVALFLIWQKRDLLGRGGVADSAPSGMIRIVGWVLFSFGLLVYVVGRSQGILLFEVGSQIPVLLGVLLILLGSRSAAEFWFPLFFLLFILPLPGFVVNAATGPLKQYVSVLAEQALYFFNYPIARSGVTLTIGPYQLLVADACSGLHSMFSLSAMGLLYLYLMRHTSTTRNLILIASILPIAFFANVMRVILLVLITYHLGDEAGQGFLHGFAGILLFVIGLLFLFLLDAFLGLFLKDKISPRSKAA